MFSSIRTEYADLIRKSPYSFQMREYKCQKTPEHGHFFRIKSGGRDQCHLIAHKNCKKDNLLWDNAIVDSSSENILGIQFDK